MAYNMYRNSVCGKCGVCDRGLMSEAERLRRQLSRVILLEGKPTEMMSSKLFGSKFGTKKIFFIFSNIFFISHLTLLWT